MSNCGPTFDPCAPCGPCGPASPCGPCGPFYNPLGSLCIPERGPQMYTTSDLCTMPQCPTVCPPPPCGPRFVTVQQPPRTVCRKDIVYCKRSVIDKHVLPCTKAICEPKLIYTPRTICEPVVVWKKRVIPCPKILWYKKVVPDPKVVCTTRTITEPKEICRTLVCQPRPQIIQVPPPKEYCCYPTGANFAKPEPFCGNPAQVPCLPGRTPGCPPPGCGPCDMYCGTDCLPSGTCC